MRRGVLLLHVNVRLARIFTCNFAHRLVTLFRIVLWDVGGIGADKKIAFARVVNFALFDEGTEGGVHRGGQVVGVESGKVSGQAGQDGIHVSHALGLLQLVQDQAQRVGQAGARVLKNLKMLKN